jgi:hypothetical protein
MKEQIARAMQLTNGARARVCTCVRGNNAPSEKFELRAGPEAANVLERIRTTEKKLPVDLGGVTGDSSSSRDLRWYFEIRLG